MQPLKYWGNCVNKWLPRYITKWRKQGATNKTSMLSSVSERREQGTRNKDRETTCNCLYICILWNRVGNSGCNWGRQLGVWGTGWEGDFFSVYPFMHLKSWFMYMDYLSKINFLKPKAQVIKYNSLLSMKSYSVISVTDKYWAVRRPLMCLLSKDSRTFGRL